VTLLPAQAAASNELIRQAAASATRAGASLLVFIRDAQHRSGTPWTVPQSARSNLTLRGPQSPDMPWQVLELGGDAGDVEGWCAAQAIDLAAGTCVVGLPLLHGDDEVRQEITVPLCAGYRTEIYIEARDNVLFQRQLDIASAALRIVPHGSTAAVDDSGFHETELARLALMEGRTGVDGRMLAAAARCAEDAPLLALYSACLLASAPTLDVPRLRGLCEVLERGPLQLLADVSLLRALADSSATADPNSGLEFETPPCMATLWAVASRLQVHFTRPVQQAVCLWRRASPIWTQTQVPAGGVPRHAGAAPPQLISFLRRGMEDDPSNPQAVIRDAARAWLVDEDLISELAMEPFAR